jgi:hypothetical protein
VRTLATIISREVRTPLIAQKLYKETTETTLTLATIISLEVRTTLITKNLYEETTETTLMRY